MGVARASLYAVLKRKERDKAILAKILRVLDARPYRRMSQLQDEIGDSTKVIRRVMKKYGILKRRRKKWKNSKENKKTHAAPNLWKGRCPLAPNAVWAGDFTEILFHGTKIYLATVIDVFTREIVGWSIGRTHDTDLILRAMEDAKEKCHGRTSELFHSDQGSEYGSRRFREWLVIHRITQSQSVRASPWQNGHQESWYGRLKGGLGDVNRFLNSDDVHDAIAEEILLYNTRWTHGTLRMSPKAFHDLWERETPLARMVLAQKSRGKTRVKTV